MKQVICSMLAVWCASAVVCAEESILLWSEPSDKAPVVGVLLTERPYFILRVVEQWVEVRQDQETAWMKTADLFELISATGSSQRLAPFHLDLSAARNLPFHYQSGVVRQIESLLSFIGDHQELSRKMNDPFYRHRVSQIGAEWNFFYYRKTPSYYVQGLNLATFAEGQLNFSLVNRRMNYQQLFGALWSSEFIEAVLKSNRGILRNRQLFGDGDQYYLELRYEF